MEKKFTPGPWAYYERPNTKEANRSYWHIDAGQGYYNPVLGPGFTLAGFLSEEDARLIAASPKLLWALEWAAAALQLACRPGRAIAEGSVIESQGVTKTVAAILNEADAAIAKAIGVQTAPAGVMLEVDGIPFSWQEFHRNNSGEDAMISSFDLAKVEALKVGESLYLGIQEVKRIQ